MFIVVPYNLMNKFRNKAIFSFYMQTRDSPYEWIGV